MKSFVFWGIFQNQLKHIKYMYFQCKIILENSGNWEISSETVGILILGLEAKEIPYIGCGSCP